jgi:UV DNA damage repair endonuclease
MGEVIDRKFKIDAISLNTGKKYTHNNSVLFLAKDELLPKLLDKYHELCVEAKVDNRQLLGVSLLKERVIAWQRKNIKKVHLPDVSEGKEEKRICKNNKT